LLAGVERGSIEQFTYCLVTSAYGIEQATIEVYKVSNLLFQLVLEYQQVAEDVATSNGANNSAAIVAMEGGGEVKDQMATREGGVNRSR
jgi:hypothetical protein